MSSKAPVKNGDELPVYSLSHYFPPFIKYLFVVILLSTMGVLVFSNLHEAEFVQLQIRPTYKTYEAFSMLNRYDNSTSMMDYLEDEIVKMTGLVPYIKPKIARNVSYSAEYKKDVFSITIVSSIKDFWDSGAYSLAIIIAAASLIWPYIKLSILIIVWLKPMHQNSRTKIILFLDQMGKWSYMDLYASVIVTVTFYVAATFHFRNLHLDVKIVCELAAGIVTFVIVNLISMAYSTAFIFWDQKYGYPHHVENVMASANILYADKLKKKINATPDLSAVREQSVASSRNPLGTPVFYSPPIAGPPAGAVAVQNTDNDEDEDEFWKSDIGLPMHSDMEPPKYKITGTYKSFIRAHIHLWRCNQKYQIFAGLYRPQSYFGIVCFSWFLCGLLLCLWLIIETVSTCTARFDINGIIGLLIDDNTRCYDPIQTTSRILTTTDTHSYALFLAICYFSTIVVFPIVTQCTLILLWIFPMKHKTFVFVLKSVWFVQAWNALDVFFVGSVAGAMQIELVSSWIIDTQIPALCGDEGVFENCFIVNGFNERGAWMAGAAAAYQWITMYFTLTLAKDIGVHGIEY